MRQLQAEVRKLKEQLVQALASQVSDSGADPALGGPSVLMGKAELFTYITNANNTVLKSFTFVLTATVFLFICLHCSFSFCFPFFQTGSSIDIQHDVLYKTKFMSAIRLFKKRDEEKKVCLFLFFL